MFPIQIASHAIDQYRQFCIKPFNSSCNSTPDRPSTSTTTNPCCDYKEPCPTCGTLNPCMDCVARGNPLVRQGIISDPIFSDVPNKKQRNTFSQGRVLTSDELIKELKNNDKASKVTKQGTSTLQDNADNSGLPTLNAVQKSKRNNKSCDGQKIQKGTITKNEKGHKQKRLKKDKQTSHVEVDTDCVDSIESWHSTFICGFRGKASDDANGILWVGCDNSMWGMVLLWMSWRCRSNS